MSLTPRPPVASAAAARASFNGVGVGLAEVTTTGDAAASSFFWPPHAATAPTLATTSPTTIAFRIFTSANIADARVQELLRGRGRRGRRGRGGGPSRSVGGRA